MSKALLEVAVRTPRDVPGADEGGADRLHLVGEPAATGALGPEPQLVSAVCRDTELPVFCLLRLNDSWTTTGGELTRLVGLAEDYLACGAAGVSFGFLDPDLEVDAELCGALSERLPGVPWTFHEAFDLTLDAERSWARAVGLSGLVAVRSAGSPRGLAVGYDDLLALAVASRPVARLLMPGEGLQPEQVPWFVRAGVRAFHLGAQARPGAGQKADVDASHVRSWRLLLDDATARAERSAAG
jgi:copper homeostasis protein